MTAGVSPTPNEVLAQYGEVADVKATCTPTVPGGESQLSVTVSATHGYNLDDLRLQFRALPTELIPLQSEAELQLIKNGETQVMTLRIGTKPETPDGKYLVSWVVYFTIWGGAATFEKAAVGSTYLVVGNTNPPHGETNTYNSPTTSPNECFIATAAYGTPTEPKLNILRKFRDQVLMKSTFGTKIIAFYYRTSPPIAIFISKYDNLRAFVRIGFIDPIVWILERTSITDTSNCLGKSKN